MSAISIFIFWSASDAWQSRLTVRITGRQLPDKSDAWSHMGLGFELTSDPLTSEALTSAVYFEALLGYGFTGPHPLEKLLAFQKRGGRISIQPTDITGPAAEQIRRRCMIWTAYKSYYAWQLVLMWAYERFGRFRGWRIPRSPGRIVCSEAAACLLWPHYDLRDDVRTEFDEVNPNSAYRKWQEIKKSATKNEESSLSRAARGTRNKS